MHFSRAGEVQTRTIDYGNALVALHVENTFHESVSLCLFNPT